jgi:hypothetical protein
MKMLISQNEQYLLSDIREIAYGDFFDVEITKGGAITNREVSPKEAGLLRAVREYGKLDKIVVHDNEPVSAEAMTKTQSGRKCLKRLRF